MYTTSSLRPDPFQRTQYLEHEDVAPSPPHIHRWTAHRPFFAGPWASNALAIPSWAPVASGVPIPHDGALHGPNGLPSYRATSISLGASSNDTLPAQATQGEG